MHIGKKLQVANSTLSNYNQGNRIKIKNIGVTLSNPKPAATWEVVKSVSLGDLITLVMVFISAAVYIARNEEDKTRLGLNLEASNKTFQTYVQTQATIDTKQDIQRDDLKRDLLTRMTSVDTKLDNITYYLMKGKQ